MSENYNQPMMQQPMQQPMQQVRQYSVNIFNGSDDENREVLYEGAVFTLTALQKDGDLVAHTFTGSDNQPRTYYTWNGISVSHLINNAKVFNAVSSSRNEILNRINDFVIAKGGSVQIKVASFVAGLSRTIVRLALV